METIKCENYCVIEDLIEKPFSNRSPEEKHCLVALAVPRPAMSNLRSHYCRGTRTLTRKFCVDSYQASKWMCGSEKLNKLFCWPCVLFHGSKDKGVWSKTGFADLNHLSAGLKVHASSREHIVNSMALKEFGRMRVDQVLYSGRETARKNHNLLVDKNRKHVRTLIDIVCFLGTHGLDLEGYNAQEGYRNRGNFKDFCYFMASNDSTLEEFLNGYVFNGTSGNIQKELIECVGEVIIGEIRKEVAEADFVAILLDEATDSVRPSQLSCALRYVKKNGQPVERMVRLADVSGDKTAVALAGQVDILAQKFGLTDKKLVAQTYDGAALMSEITGGIQALIKEKFPRADFIYCRAHVLNSVLLRACVTDRVTGSFFKSLSSLASFFSPSSKRVHELKKIVEAEIPNVCRTEWAHTSRMVNVVEENYDGFLTCLEEIFLGDSDCDGDTCALARGLHSAMLEFDFIFLLQLFASIFAHTHVLYRVLQTNELDMIECHKHVKQCRDDIEKLKSSDNRREIVNKAVTVTGECESKNREDLITKIVDNILNELDRRFESLGSFRYVGLLNACMFVFYENSFPSDLIEPLKVTFKEELDTTKLLNELKVLYTKKEFAGKKVYELLCVVLDYDLEDVFSETCKLAKLILTLPSTTATRDRSFSVLHRLRNYLRSTRGEERLFYLMLMAVEGELLDNIKQRSTFHDEVTNLFASRVQRHIPLMYK